jgi:chromosome segregation ATPase
LPNSTKFSTKIQALEKELSLKKTELAEAKKTGIKKDGEISRLKSNSTKFSTKIQVLEKELALTKTELAEVKKTDVKKDGEISKLNEDINFLLDSLDDLDAELKVQVGAYEKYKKLITCYRTALINWDDLHRRQGLTEQDHFVIRIELRRSLFSCPPM